MKWKVDAVKWTWEILLLFLRMNWVGNIAVEQKYLRLLWPLSKRTVGYENKNKNKINLGNLANLLMSDCWYLKTISAENITFSFCKKIWDAFSNLL